MMFVAASRPVNNIQPINALLQLAHRQFSGCIQIVSDETLWVIYFERGEIIYGTTVNTALPRLEYYLDSIELPDSNQSSKNSGVSASRLMSVQAIQERLVHEKEKAVDSLPSPDYQFIGWLVEEKYLNASQASSLVEMMIQESVELLCHQDTGVCKLFKLTQNSSMQKICTINTWSMLDKCRKEARNKGTSLPDKSFSSPQIKSSDCGALVQLRPTTNLDEKDSNSRKKTPNFLNLVTQPRRSQANTSPVIAQLAKNKYVIGCIDDSPAVLKNLCSYLDDQQFSVFTVNNPVKALMTIMRHKPDLILLDVMMPELDGYELCSLLRKHPKFKITPIIIVTSNTGLIDRAKAKVVRASGYLTKPFTKQDLMKIIGKYLKIDQGMRI